MREIKFNENKAICEECGGRCCKNIPGIFQPSDIELDAKKIAEKLIKNLWAIDCYEDSPKLYYLRPATKNSSEIYDYSWGGECVFLTATGCSLSWENRPSGCRAVKPNHPKKCTCPDKYGKYQSGKAWQEYVDLLHEAATIAKEAREGIFS
jgi:Fe-S-cluster containining protein